MRTTDAITEIMPLLMPARIVVAGPVSDWLAIFFTGPYWSDV